MSGCQWGLYKPIKAGSMFKGVLEGHRTTRWGRQLGEPAGRSTIEPGWFQLSCSNVCHCWGICDLGILQAHRAVSETRRSDE